MADLEALIRDLYAETDDLASIVEHAGGAASFSLPTPAAGWSVGDTLAHLWFFDREATKALTEPEAFAAEVTALLAGPDAERLLETHVAEGRTLGDELLPTFREQRDAMVAALRAVDPKSRVPWYGPPMSPMSFGTARLMETWAHGQDIVDAVGAQRAPTARLRHIADLGVRTRLHSFTVRGLAPPDQPVFVSLTAPDGETWTWGDPDAADRVEGPAEDFALLVTQRRLQEDLRLSATGEAANAWLSIAQAFAGGATTTDESRRQS
ncbi:MAG TPA: TIGR03084 family metal-binding protein [Mycobacteriales bacterium]|nr:TIGR03084 family metal-binding protein [Mycobacteriales bacterium]